MRLKFIGCKVLTREVSKLVATSKNFIDMTWIRQGFHDEPAKLRKIIQENIDKVDSDTDSYSCQEDVGEFDAILIGYGLCSNGIEGLSSKKHKLVIPKAHDCISLFLGSRQRYQELFDKYSGGIYWYTSGWIENSIMPSEERDKIQYDRYVEEYGEDNAEFLMESQSGWMKEYKAAVYIDTLGVDTGNTKNFTKQAASYLNWEFLDVKGDLRLLENLLAGNWDESDFLVVKPGEKVASSHNSDVINVTKV